MRLLASFASAATVLLATFAAPTPADEIRLTNGDTLNGTVVSLDKTSLTLRSENFGELTVPRSNIALIGLGEDGLPEPVVVAAPGDSTTNPGGGGLGGGLGGGSLGGADVGQLLNNPQLQQQFGGLLGEALGGQSIGDAQQNLRQTQQSYRELADDIGGLEGDAINSYLQIFDVLGGGLGAAGQVAPQPAPRRAGGQPPQTTPQSTPPASSDSDTESDASSSSTPSADEGGE